MASLAPICWRLTTKAFTALSTTIRTGFSTYAWKLLYRLLDVSRSEPEQPLPRRDEPLTERIDAIAEHLRWWTKHYTQQMESYPVEHKLNPP